MTGGLGNDTFIVDDAGDVAVEKAGEGTDTELSSVTRTLEVNVENLTLTGAGNVNGTGNSGNNVLTGNIGNNALTGGEGDDWLDGGAGGADTLMGGLGNDTYVWAPGNTLVENPGEGNDTVRSASGYTLGTNFEKLELTGGADVNGATNSNGGTLVGNSGRNRLTGSDAADFFDGGAGNDTLIGGLGTDKYAFNRGGGRDEIVENASLQTSDQDKLTFALTGGAGGRIDYDQLWFTRVGSDLEVNVIGTNDTVRVNDWFTLSGAAKVGTHQIENILAGNGADGQYRTLANTDVQQLVDAMAGMTPPPASATSWSGWTTAGQRAQLMAVWG
jgi:Ca2+-binding RTX toxin-like protein